MNTISGTFFMDMKLPENDESGELTTKTITTQIEEIKQILSSLDINIELIWKEIE